MDVRANIGGNVSQVILERLGKKLLGTRFGNGDDHPEIDPSTVFHGHMVALTNETSDGDGVTPDIEVENDPISMQAGIDVQLDRGVQEVPKWIAEQPMSLPKRPADPVKTKYAWIPARTFRLVSGSYPYMVQRS